MTSTLNVSKIEPLSGSGTIHVGSDSSNTVSINTTTQDVTFANDLIVTGGLNVGTIKDVTGTTTAMTINSNGGILTPARPILAVRGMAGSTSLTAADTNFDYATSWTTTDVNVGSLLNAGGYAQVPTGFGGTYQITWIVNGTAASDFNSSVAFAYNGSTYTLLWEHFASDDYQNYTVGTTLFYTLNEGDRVYVGYDDRFGVPSSLDRDCNFSMMFVG